MALVAQMENKSLCCCNSRNCSKKGDAVMSQIILIPQDRNFGEKLVKDGYGRFENQQVIIPLNPDELQAFLVQMPRGSSFLVKETGEIIIVADDELILEKKLCEILTAWRSEQVDEIYVNKLLKPYFWILEQLKAAYGLTISEAGMRAEIKGIKRIQNLDEAPNEFVIVRWDGRVLYDNNEVCDSPRETLYKDMLENFQLPDLFAALEEAITRKQQLTTLDKQVPLEAEERKIFREKYLAIRGLSLKHAIVQSFEIELNSTLQQLLKLAQPLSETEIMREWQWLVKTYIPPLRVFRQKETITIDNSAKNIQLAIGPYFSLQLHRNGEKWNTAALLQWLNNEEAITVCRLYCQGNLPGLIVFLLDRFDCLS